MAAGREKEGALAPFPKFWAVGKLSDFFFFLRKSWFRNAKFVANFRFGET